MISCKCLFVRTVNDRPSVVWILLSGRFHRISTRSNKKWRGGSLWRFCCCCCCCCTTKHWITSEQFRSLEISRAQFSTACSFYIIIFWWTLLFVCIPRRGLVWIQCRYGNVSGIEDYWEENCQASIHANERAACATGTHIGRRFVGRWCEFSDCSLTFKEESAQTTALLLSIHTKFPHDLHSICEPLFLVYSVIGAHSERPLDIRWIE